MTTFENTFEVSIRKTQGSITSKDVGWTFGGVSHHDGLSEPRHDGAEQYTSLQKERRFKFGGKVIFLSLERLAQSEKVGIRWLDKPLDRSDITGLWYPLWPFMKSSLDSEQLCDLLILSVRLFVLARNANEINRGIRVPFTTF
jgi:hypothetical protein